MYVQAYIAYIAYIAIINDFAFTCNCDVKLIKRPATSARIIVYSEVLREFSFEPSRNYPIMRLT